MYRVLLALFFGAFALQVDPLQGGLLPTLQLDQDGVRSFEQYVARYETGPHDAFLKSGVMWIDGQGESRKKQQAAGKAYTETLAGENVPGGHIHHLFGSVWIPGGTVAVYAATMQNYGRYPEYFKPDIAKGSSIPLVDSSPAARHFHVSLEMVHSTAWMDVAFDTSYDTRYVFLDDRRTISTSRSEHIREYLDAHNLSLGKYPEGSDHGFLWKTYTSWHVREGEGGLYLEVNSISLCRSIPAGAGWWANRTARATTEKMIQNTAIAIRGNLGANQTGKADRKPST